MSEVPAEHMEFIKEKRKQLVGLVVGSLSFGALAGAVVAVLRGEPMEAMAGVQTMGVNLLIAGIAFAVAGFAAGRSGET